MENGCLLIAASGSRFATRVVMGDGNRGLKATVTVGRSLRDDGIQKVDVCFQMCLLSDVLSGVAFFGRENMNSKTTAT